MLQTLYKSIYDINDLTNREEEFAHTNANIYDMRYKKELKATQSQRRFWQKVLPKSIYKHYSDSDRFWDKIMKNIKAPTSKEEYIQATTQIERYEHLFYIFMMRGNFPIARQYELISKKNYIKYESIPHDVLFNNELEYYKWLKQHT